jgi:hydrogenase small subunit
MDIALRMICCKSVSKDAETTSIPTGGRQEGTMKDVSRRDFMKYCIGSAAVLGLNLTVLGKLEKALAAGSGPPIVWLNGANCTGCTVSLANLYSNSNGTTNVADLLLNTIDLAFHPNLMGATGDLAVAELRSASTREGGFVLAVDGGIPTAFGGHTCMLWTEDGREITAVEAVQELAPKAAAVLAIGTCASFGGVPSGDPNPTGIRSISQIAGVSTINIPGCPTHPDWVVGTIAQLLAGESPDLDDDGRPKAFFKKKIHDRCPRKEEDKAKTFGIEGRCLKEVGCKGPKTKADCYSRYWNNGTNWCIGANAICIGCTENGFPDKFSPFYDGEGRDGEYEEEDDD